MNNFWLPALVTLLLVGGGLFYVESRKGDIPSPAPVAIQEQEAGTAPTPSVTPVPAAENNTAQATNPEPPSENAVEAEVTDGQAQPVTQEENPPDGDKTANEAMQPVPATPDMPGMVRGVVAKGDTFEKLFADMDDAQAARYMQAVRSVMRLRSLRAGQPFCLVRGEGNTITRFEYEMDATSRLVVEGIDEPQARIEAIPYDIKLVSVGSTIADNLFQTVDDLGEHPQMAITLANLFAAEINFIRDLQEGDSFTALVEKRYRDGQFRGYGRFLAATFTNKGKTFEAFLYRNGSERPQHYNRKGENLRKTLLQAPLAFTRVSSKFSHNRRHPILGHSRPHLGVDYAAPSGTPVRAVGDGTVTFVGWSGGYGKQIIVKHGAGLESMYSHLSGYARGVRTGHFVKQGQNIGFVGSTGLSTGPHLDFRLKQNGNFINPAKSINPRGEPVSVKNRADFAKTVDLYLDFMQGGKALGEYAPEMVLPATPVAVPERKAVAPKADGKKGKATRTEKRPRRDKNMQRQKGKSRQSRRNRDRGNR